jgi:hypothetical protein
MIGLLLHTFHTSPVPCDDTAGVYLLADGYTAGLFKNSECHPGAWAGWAPETNVLTLGPVRAKAGVTVGAIAGYKSRPILPLLLPSIAISLDSQSWLRATFLPKFKTGAGGVALSVEFTF